MNIDEFRLTPEYIKSRLPLQDGYSYYQEFGEAVANTATRTAIEKMMEWGEEPCPHSKFPYSNEMAYGDKKNGCPQCWQSLKPLLEE